MASKTSTSKSNKSSARSSAKKKQTITEAGRIQNHRMWSTILFILGVFLLFLTWIKGESLWQAMQTVLWGLFGVSTAILAPIVIYVAAMLALDKSKSTVVTKLIQGLVLLFLISPTFELIHSFAAKTPAFAGDNFAEKITALYTFGAEERQGGGALSIFVGGALSGLCGEVCAFIIIILLMILFIMLLTNITFVDVFRAISRLFGRIRNSVRESNEEAAVRQLEKQKALEAQREKEEQSEKEKNKQRLMDSWENFDAPVSNGKSEEKPKRQPKKPAPVPLVTPEDFLPAEEKNKREEPEVMPEEPVVVEKIAAEAEKPKPAGKTSKAKEETPKAEEPVIISEDDTVNPIYVDKDGQTTLIEMETATETGYAVPPIDLLNPPQAAISTDDTLMETDRNAETLVETLKSFGVVTRIVGVHRGPSVTRYELQPAAGVKVSRITSLSDDIALNLAANGVRIEAPIPGKAAVGIELANKVRETVCIRELIDSNEFRSSGGKLCFPVGKDIEGKIIVGDISKMPHVLIAGTTGSGKSVFTNSIIMSILYNASPDEVKLILIDPKQVEFPVYNGIPHLLIPVVTEAKKAAGALGWAVTEMLKRYKLFADNSVRDLKDYNKMAASSDVLTPMPQMVIVVDELADLMMAAPKEVEDSICRLAQLARAAGMHLIIATQSPRVDIVTGLIKANIPSRVALKVSNQIDSRVILDEGGADKLLGNGDLLYKPVGLGKPVRVQGSYVATEEIKRVVDYLRASASSQYDEEVAAGIEKHIPVPKGEKPAQESGQESTSDNMTERAAEAVIEAGQASTSYLQRKLKLGYARAARIMDELEEMGIVGQADGAKPREVRLTRAQWLERNALNSSSETTSDQD